MSDSARRSVDRKSTVAPMVGRYVGNDGDFALVDLGDQRVPVRFASWAVPQINEAVWVDSVDGLLRLTGPTAPKPGIGVIETVTGTEAVVQTDFGKYTLTVAPTDPMPTSGDTVGIHWSSQPWCTLLVDLPDVEPPPPPPSGGAGQEVKTAVFRAIDTGSTDRHQARWWKSEPTAWNTTYGAWFYGSQIKDTVPADAQFVSLEFYVSYRQRRGGAPRFALHDAGTKIGLPSFSAYNEWAPEGGDFRTPPDPHAWFELLTAGGGYAGVGLNQGGDNVFSNLVQDSMSGALRLQWR